ncbi:hypothetical protein [Geminisphaera colitermitum]|uniref:hypothetical protein n=1 Tax=Geminisphaera colitermitum TaxID=1148786 RepID=UPI001E480421|nr:hypothetical protein [Geminisphaera colitermitum]
MAAICVKGQGGGGGEEPQLICINDGALVLCGVADSDARMNSFSSAVADVSPTNDDASVATAAFPAAVALTRGPKHHFFGYYEKCPWDASGRRLLAMESAFMHRPPTADDVLTLGFVETDRAGGGGAFTPFAETRAWNWQQGCMLQWLGDGSSGDVIFNDRIDGRLVSRIFNLNTGRERVLDRPVYAVNRSGTTAVSLNFARLQHQRPGYGYAGVPDAWREVLEPEDDGVYAIDLASGRSRLILSVAEAARFQRGADFGGLTHRFNHAQFGADDRRFAVLHRRKSPNQEVGSTRLLTLDIDGGGLRCLTDHELVSHYDWRGGDAILAWANRNESGPHYYLFDDNDAPPARRIEMIGDGVLTCDGHCSFSPNGEWVLSDTYPDKRDHHRTLFLWHMESRRRVDIGRFLSPPMEWQIRCDLHPRWARDGRSVCIDSIHEGPRQMYRIDVSEIVGR